MFDRKYLLVLTLFALLDLGCVSASDNNTFNCTESTLSLDDSSDDICESYFDGDLLSRTYTLSGGKFSDIQDTIDKASSGDTIQLSGKFRADDVDSIIKINKKLTITSKSTATLDGRDISGIFALSKKAKGSVISNLKFVHGYRFSASAIFIDAKDITIKKCTFTDNEGYGNGGGAVATYWDKDRASGLTISNCTFKNNVAPASSGAVAAFSTNFKIINCNFISNAAYNHDGRTAYEGALQAGMSGTTGLIKGCTFKNNYVISNNKKEPSYGGALGIRKGTTVEDCYFESNSADHGGAIFFFSSGTVTNCHFIKNNADLGGALYSKEDNFEVYNSEFNNNSAKNGGSVYVENANVNVYNSDFKYDLSAKGASVYAVKSKINIFDSNFNNDDADEGGAVYALDSKVIVKKSIFKSNGADIGGVISGNSNLEIYDSNFTDNFAEIKAGVINADKGTLKIYNSNFHDNYAKEYAGSIFLNSADIQIFKSLFDDNEANFGGAVYVGGNSNLLINGCDFNLNVALNGSAIYNKATLKIYDSNFKDNQAKSYEISSTSNSPIKQGNDIIIEVKLAVGDNIIDAIYNSGGKVLIDDNDPHESCMAANQEILLEFNNETYVENTDEEGIARFVIDSGNIKGGDYNYTFYHPGSAVYDFIEGNDTLEVIEELHNEVLKKPDKTVKQNKKTKYSPKTTSKKIKKSKKGKKAIKHKHHLRKFKKRAYENPFDIVKWTKKGIGTFNKMIKYSKGDIWRFLDYPIINIPSYKKYSKKYPDRAEVIDILFGFDKNGKMSFLDSCLNLVSIIPGLGLSGRTLKFLGKYARKIPKMGKLIDKYKLLMTKDKKFQQFIKRIRRGIDLISNSLDLIKNSAGKVYTTVVGQSAKVFKKKNLENIANSLRKNKPLGDKFSNFSASLIDKFSESNAYKKLKNAYKFFDNSVRSVGNSFFYPNYKEAYNKSKLAKKNKMAKRNPSLKAKYRRNVESKINSYLWAGGKNFVKTLNNHTGSAKKQIKIKTKDRIEYKFYKKTIKIQKLAKRYYSQSTNKKYSQIKKLHSTYKKYNHPKNVKKTSYSSKVHTNHVFNNHKVKKVKSYNLKRNFKLRQRTANNTLKKIKSKINGCLNYLIRR